MYILHNILIILCTYRTIIIIVGYSHGGTLISVSHLFVMLDVLYFNYPDICVTGPSLTLVGPDNQRSTVYTVYS